MRDYIKYFLIFIFILWIVGFLQMINNSSGRSFSFISSDGSQQNEDLSAQLLAKIKQVEKELSHLEIKNLNNEIIIKNLKSDASLIQHRRLRNSDSSSLNAPGMEFEETRRKIFTDLKEVTNFINSELNQLEGKHERVKPVLDSFNHRMKLLMAEFYNLSTTSSYIGDWRYERSRILAKKVQEKFTKLQNPTDCKNSKKIVCDLNKACGFGCQMHHVMYCFITSYFTGRTMILESNQWRYNPDGYEAYFKPVSDTCKTSNEKTVNWNDANTENIKSIRMPIIDVINVKPQFLPLSVPKEFLNDLKTFHGDPFVWWAGQILTYLMRFNDKFSEIVNTNRVKLKFETPCVGVHVRRTDKVGTEAAFHSLSEYMKYVDEYFDIYELRTGKKVQRTVFLATDEVSVLAEARQKYPEYNFLFDESVAKSASVNQRYSPESAQGVILDIYFLSQCDYLVCTFSSQVCRMAYELMQDRYPDASWRFKSLDDVYYFGGQNGHVVKALYEHVPRRENMEIQMKPGDFIGLSGNHWNGYSKGRNLRTNEEGLFPSYKVVDVVQSY